MTTDALAFIFDDVKKRMNDKTLQIGEFGDQSINTLSTGIATVDQMLSGGLPEGKIIEVFGPEASGKTTLLLHCIAAAQQRGDVVYFIDAEHALDFSYAKRIGVDPEKIQFTQPDYGEQALELARNICVSVGEYNKANKTDVRSIIVIDSIPALVPKQQFEAIAKEGFDSPLALGARARMLAEKVPPLSIAASNSNTTVVFINQERDKINPGPGAKTSQPGGRTVKFFASLRLKVVRIGQHKEAGEAVGIKTKIMPVKSKHFQIAGRDVELVIGNEGIDLVAPFIDGGLSLGVINKSGAWYEFNGIRGQGMKKFKDLLLGDEEKGIGFLKQALANGVPSDE